MGANAQSGYSSDMVFMNSLLVLEAARTPVRAPPPPLPAAPVAASCPRAIAVATSTRRLHSGRRLAVVAGASANAAVAAPAVTRCSCSRAQGTPKAAFVFVPSVAEFRS